MNAISLLFNWLAGLFTILLGTGSLLLEYHLGAACFLTVSLLLLPMERRQVSVSRASRVEMAPLATGSSAEPHADGRDQNVSPSGDGAPFPRGTGQRVGWFAFFVRASIWSVVTYSLVQSFPGSDFGVGVISVILLSVPIALSGLYLATIKQIRRLTFFDHKGWIHALMSRRILKGIFWMCWALASALFILFHFHTCTPVEWGVLWLTVPVFLIVFSLSRGAVSREWKPYLVTERALRISARWICPFLMVGLYLLVLYHVAEAPRYGSLGEAVGTYVSRAEAHEGGSAFFNEVSFYLAHFDGAKAYLTAQVSEEGRIYAIVLLALGGWVLFFNACAILSCFLIPRVEYRRVLNPLSDTERPMSPTTGAKAAVAVLALFAISVLFVPALAHVEQWIKEHPELSVKGRNGAQSVVEVIDGVPYRRGTIKLLENEMRQAASSVEFAMGRLHAQIDRSFDLVEANVDRYLDWYYSIPAEYLRIASLVAAGAIEDVLVERLQDLLLYGDPFREVEAALEQVIETHESAAREYEERRQDIMERNRVYPPKGAEIKIVRSTSLHEVLSFPLHKDVINLKARVGASVTVGTLTGIVIATKVAKDVSRRCIFKQAAKAATRVVGAKGGGVAAGVALGGAVGSVVPGVGTVVGAVVGGIVGGVSAALIADKLLLMLEEAISRESFREEIVSSIHSTKEEFAQTLLSGSGDEASGLLVP